MGSYKVDLSDNARRILESRYLQKNMLGEMESPGEMFWRVAHAVSRAELDYGSSYDAACWEEAFYQAMLSLLFLPNSPTLMNAGLPNSQLSACYVLPVENDTDAIYRTVEEASLIQQRGGGVGYNVSGLRPRGDFYPQYGHYAAGPLAFIRAMNHATESISQKLPRGGANMGVLNIEHPDIEAFILSKKDEKKLRNFNISVGMRDAFMHALGRDAYWELLHPLTRRVVKKVKARKIWQMLVHSAWKSGEPGILYLDAMQQDNPLPGLSNLDTTNPCGEVPLLAYESCNLGSVNLARMLVRRRGSLHVDWEKLAAVVALGVRFLDNVIEVNHYTSPLIQNMTRANRKIGLGVMGWAEMLIQMEVPYKSLEAVRLAGEVMHFIQQVSLETSVVLARERGVFSNWRHSKYFRQQIPLRNATLNSIAPTGTISIIADTPPSIEPLYALAFRREHVLGEETLHEVNREVLRYLKDRHLYDLQIMEQIQQRGSVQHLSTLPSLVKNLLRTSLEIPYRYHLKHQQAFQRFTDNAVSKTINLPAVSRVEDVAQIFYLAWKLGLKGVTVYRDGSRTKQVLSSFASGVNHREEPLSHCRPCV
jgi:ribonucleoside-diphosphate reductase alpha chain